MTKNLEVADNIVKIVLAIATIVLFFTHIIAGPFAVFLMLLSCLVLLIWIGRKALKKFGGHRNR